MSDKEKIAEERAVANFREYLRIPTVHPNPDYAPAIQFLKQMADYTGLIFTLVEVSPNHPVAIFTLLGKDVSLPSIMLNSHIDVVPVFSDHWKVDPFSADKMENGDIFARGAQDMKCVGMQYLEAIKKMSDKGKTFPRTIHVTFVPDEEVGGSKGMNLFVKSNEFKKLNVGFALDEGLANPTEAFTVFYGERCPWWVKVTTTGDPGHGSKFVQNSAAEKMRKIINSFLDFRAREEKRLKEDQKLKLGDVTTVNMTVLQGGVQMNVIPAELTVGFDIRIPPNVNMMEFEETIEGWCIEAGEGVSYTFAQKATCQKMTSTKPGDKWWSAFKMACNDMQLEIELEVFPAATDSRYLRELEIPALGFSPMNKTPILLHDHNEYLNENIFLRGIDIYCQIISAIASVK